jgi:hypothetical protein
LSVLIKATTILVERQHLDTSFPGGVPEFVRQVGESLQPRLVCDHDPEFVSVSFDDRTAAAEASRWLRTMTGATSAEDATDGAGDQTAEGLFRLASQHGIEISLDLTTGREIATDTDGNPVTTMPSPTPLHDELVRALAGTGWQRYFDEAPTVMVDLRGDAALYSSRYFVSEEMRTLVCTTRAPVFVPERARERAMQFITRANFGMFYGSFELDLDDGTLLFRTNCAVRDGTLTTDMVSHLASAGAWAFDRYLPRLLEVLFGRRRVRDAVEEAEQA